jgi:hypothetical protein
LIAQPWRLFLPVSGQKVDEGIPYAINSITQKRKNTGAIMGTMGWLAFDVITIVQSLFWGKNMVLGWFKDNAPKDGPDLEKYEHVVGNLSLVWDTLDLGCFRGRRIYGVVRCFLFYQSREARLADSPYSTENPFDWRLYARFEFCRFNGGGLAYAAYRVPINDVLRQSGEAATSPDVCHVLGCANEQLSRGVGLGSALDREPLKPV